MLASNQHRWGSLVIGVLYFLLAACSPNSPAPATYSMTANPGVHLGVTRNIAYQVEAGTTLQLGIERQTNDINRTTRPVRANWSVEAMDGVRIDEDGRLEVAGDVPHGTVLSITAQTSRGIIQNDITVYHLTENPLIGEWRMTTWISCDTGEIVDWKSAPSSSAGGLILLADGSFYAYAYQFEGHNPRYTGQYNLDVAAQTIAFTALEAGSLEPPTDVSAGPISYEIDADGHLILANALLMRISPPASQPAICGHVMERRN